MSIIADTVRSSSIMVGSVGVCVRSVRAVRVKPTIMNRVIVFVQRKDVMPRDMVHTPYNVVHLLYVK